MSYKEDFLLLAGGLISRKGITDLLNWLQVTDFFVAPASSRFHGAYEGGLVEHSVKVFYHLKDLCQFFNCEASEESIAIVALLHDLCKVNYYTVDWKNQKSYDPQKVQTAPAWSVKHDANGDFIWETVSYYRVKEQFNFGGHGSKSVYLIMNFLTLTPIEAAAINCHMGPWDRQDAGNLGGVFEDNLLAWLLHVADEAATYIDKA